MTASTVSLRRSADANASAAGRAIPPRGRGAAVLCRDGDRWTPSVRRRAREATRLPRQLSISGDSRRSAGRSAGQFDRLARSWSAMKLILQAQRYSFLINRDKLAVGKTTRRTLRAIEPRTRRTAPHAHRPIRAKTLDSFIVEFRIARDARDAVRARSIDARKGINSHRSARLFARSIKSIG